MSLDELNEAVNAYENTDMPTIVYMINNDNRVIREGDWMSRLPKNRLDQLQGLNRQDEKESSLAAGYLMSRYLGVASDGDLMISPSGKPSLAVGFPRFNLSHCEQYTVLAVSDTEIGVDIEPTDIATHLSALPHKAFSEDELRWLDFHSDDESFAVLWTQKEAVLKADGRGFWKDPAEISVFEQNQFFIQSFFERKHVISCAVTRKTRSRYDAIDIKMIL